jgi:hypothetical protein
MRQATTISVLAVVIVAVAVGIVVVGRKPVLFSFTDAGELRRPSFSLLNPFRNREPEEAADDLLRDLGRGDVMAALGRVQSAERVSPEIYAKEQKYSLRKWKLADRDDGADEVMLLYRASREPSERFDWDVRMRVQKRGDRWAVTEFITAY